MYVDISYPSCYFSIVWLIASLTCWGETGFIREWERDLQHVFTEPQLDHMYRFTHSSTVDTKMQENSYKVLTRWYRVPSKLSKIYPSLSDACWRECGLRGSFLHIWWECPKLRPFWLDIHAQIKIILDLELPDSPLESLLHFPTTPLSQYHNLGGLPQLVSSIYQQVFLFLFCFFIYFLYSISFVYVSLPPRSAVWFLSLIGGLHPPQSCAKQGW